MLAAVLAATPSTANAQEGSGDPEAGRLFAREVCAPCHVTTADQVSPPRFAIAPDFRAIANTPGITATALHAFFMTPHPKMPNLILSPPEVDDVTTYIPSLRDRN
jgi:mono/diheme cytochrome c family protein